MSETSEEFVVRPSDGKRLRVLTGEAAAKRVERAHKQAWDIEITSIYEGARAYYTGVRLGRKYNRFTGGQGGDSFHKYWMLTDPIHTEHYQAFLETTETKPHDAETMLLGEELVATEDTIVIRRANHFDSNGQPIDIIIEGLRIETGLPLSEPVSDQESLFN